MDFKWQKRSNETHVLTTDHDAKLIKHNEGNAAKCAMRCMRCTRIASGFCAAGREKGVERRCSEHEAAKNQLDELTYRGSDVRTVGVDEGYHTKEFVTQLRHSAIMSGE